MKAVIYVSFAAMAIIGLVATFAATLGDSGIGILFTAICGLVAASVAILAADSEIKAARRYVRRVRR